MEVEQRRSIELPHLRICHPVTRLRTDRSVKNGHTWHPHRSGQLLRFANSNHCPPGAVAVKERSRPRAVDTRKVLGATYGYARRTVSRGVGSDMVWTVLFMVVVGAIAGATGSRLIQYGILGAAIGVASKLVSVHSYVAGAWLRGRALARVSPRG